jgi:signal peptidase II
MTKKETFKELLIFMAIGALFLLDLITKSIFTNKSFGENGMIFIRYTENYGSSFGIFADVSFYPMLILVLSFLVILFLFLFFKRFCDDLHLVYFYVFVVAGILGNTVDRLLFGFVRDFIGLKYLFIFNFADLYITVAFVFLIMYELKSKK